MKIGFIGFGEASYYFISGMLNECQSKIMVYDVDRSKAEEQWKKLEKKKYVSITESIRELLEKTEIVFVAVPGETDEKVFSSIIDLRIENKLFVDLCTALPDVKSRIENKLFDIQCKYVDVAVMGSVPKLKQKVPMMVSGNGSEEFSRIVDRYAMDVDILGEKAGEASVIKFCRSIYMKGLAALLIETKNVSEAYGVCDKVFRSLEKSMDNDSFSDYSRRLIDGTMRHCKRRTKEMENCLKIIDRVKINGYMAEGTIRLYEELADKIN